MTWRSKLDKVRELVPSREDLIPIFECTEAGAPAEFTDWLRSEYPFADEEYLGFLAYTDGAQLGTFVLAGSGQSTLPAIPSLIRTWRESVDVKAYLPIGEDASGAVFLLGRAGDVTLEETEPSAGRERVAASFEEFLGEVLMGRRYLSLFPDGTFPDDTWFAMLAEQGWA